MLLLGYLTDEEIETWWSFTCPSHCRVEAGLEFRLTGSPSWCAPPGCTGGKASTQADSLWEEQHEGREAAGTFGRNLSLECHPRASMEPLPLGFLIEVTNSYSLPHTHTHSFSFIFFSLCSQIVWQAPALCCMPCSHFAGL